MFFKQAVLVVFCALNIATKGCFGDHTKRLTSPSSISGTGKIWLQDIDGVHIHTNIQFFLYYFAFVSKCEVLLQKKAGLVCSIMQRLQWRLTNRKASTEISQSWTFNICRSKQLAATIWRPCPVMLSHDFKLSRFKLKQFRARNSKPASETRGHFPMSRDLSFVQFLARYSTPWSVMPSQPRALR